MFKYFTKSYLIVALLIMIISFRLIPHMTDDYKMKIQYFGFGFFKRYAFISLHHIQSFQMVPHMISFDVPMLQKIFRYARDTSGTKGF